ncbi:MAG: guanylate kinase [Candidatus Pacebacteria bacterium]|nr:guanylate kinase [Candidatus Paceibacterota bacterium]
MNRKNKQLIAENIVILSGPSGAGEDTIISELSKKINLEKIITTTTRNKRPGEKNGKDYYFISEEEFKEGVKNKIFVEYAKEYNDNYYGVTEKELLRVAKSGKLGIWKIEYKGVITAKKLFPRMKAIFITAPLYQLKERINSRDGVKTEYIQERMKYTKKWLKHQHIYDFKVINRNGQLKSAVSRVIKYLETIDKQNN